MGRPDLAVEWCRATIARNPGIPTHAQAVMAIALAVTGATDEAIAASKDLLAVARNASNPSLAAATLLAYGWARRHADPTAAYDALRQAWTIAEESGNRQQASITAGLLSGLATTRGEFTDAFDYITHIDPLLLRFRHLRAHARHARDPRRACSIGSATTSRRPPSAVSERIRWRAASFPEIDEQSPICARFSAATATQPIAQAGANMTNAEMATYAFEQIDRARASTSAGETMSPWVSSRSLFTDIEGSTRRWEADAGRDAGGAGATIRCCARRSSARGQVFNYTGDGMCAVFASPRSAVDAAVDAQRELELPVRMGIATGEAELRGGDYFGTVLNRTARVMAAGHGGQILLDGATAGSAQRRRPDRHWGQRDYAISPNPSTSFKSSPGPAHRLPAAEDRRSHTGKPAAADHELCRARSRTRRVGRRRSKHTGW